MGLVCGQTSKPSNFQTSSQTIKPFQTFKPLSNFQTLLRNNFHTFLFASSGHQVDDLFTYTIID